MRVYTSRFLQYSHKDYSEYSAGATTRLVIRRSCSDYVHCTFIDHQSLIARHTTADKVHGRPCSWATAWVVNDSV